MTDAFPRNRGRLGARAAVGGALAVAAATAAGCGGGNTATSVSVSKAPTGPVRALNVTATVLSDSVEDTMPDPMQDYYENFWGNSEFLLKPKAGSTEPWVARSVARVDPRTWRITLRPGVRFQNGNPVDASAVVAWLRYEMQKDPAAKSAIGEPTQITKSASDQVTVTTKRPYEAFRNGLASYSLPVIDVATLKRLGKNYDKIAGQGIYTGPFALQSIKPGVREYVRNTHYWSGPVALKGFTLRKLADPQAGLRAVQAGEADILLTPPPRTFVAAKGDSKLAFNVADQAAVFVGAVPYSRKAPFDDAAVRRAFALSIDNDAIAKTATFGLFAPLAGLFPAGTPFAQDWKRFDLTRAGQVLDQAGWMRGADGVREKNGKRLKINLWCYSDLLEAVATSMTDTLKQAGFDATVRRVSNYPDLEDPIKKTGGVWVGNIENFGLDGNPVTSLAVNYWVNKDPKDPSILSLDDAKMLTLTKQLQAEADPTAIAAGVRRLGKLNGEGAYYVPIVTEPNTLLVSSAYRGLKPDPFYLFIDARTAPGS